LDRSEVRRDQFAWCRAAATVARHGRPGHSRHFAVLDNQVSGPNETRDLGVAELMQQAKDVPVNRLFPEALAWPEIAAYQSGINPCVERRGIEGNQSALTVAHHHEFRRLRPASR